jgi:hypothetical protein
LRKLILRTPDNLRGTAIAGIYKQLRGVRGIITILISAILLFSACDKEGALLHKSVAEQRIQELPFVLDETTVSDMIAVLGPASEHDDEKGRITALLWEQEDGSKIVCVLKEPENGEPDRKLHYITVSVNPDAH